MSKTDSTFKYCTFFAKKLDKVIILAKWLYGRKQKFVVGSPYNFVERESHISSELEARPLNINKKKMYGNLYCKMQDSRFNMSTFYFFRKLRKSQMYQKQRNFARL